MIIAGKTSEIEWGVGNWIFLDMGFSGSPNARGRTCGLLIGDEQPSCLSFAEAQQAILDRLQQTSAITNLVIEAPLSVSFNRLGNPTGRSIERQEGESPRLWYVGAGCAVMVGAMYLIRKIAQLERSGTVRLFEAFVSYKDQSKQSDHMRETQLLRNVVKDLSGFRHCIIPPDSLKVRDDDVLSSAFCVTGLDCGVPAVIRCEVVD